MLPDRQIQVVTILRREIRLKLFVWPAAANRAPLSPGGIDDAGVPDSVRVLREEAT